MCGELVLTTIGADAMPLIRYRTGDYTRILPPCPCGGITRRIDTVSRREGEICMDDLDSVLFRIPDLVDYRVSYRGKYYFHCRLLNHTTDAVLDTIEKKFPGLEAEISAESVKREQCPLYPGKRYILTD